MNLFVGIGIIAIAIAALLVWRIRSNRQKNIGFPYSRGSGLFSDVERSFLEVLEQAVGEQYRVFGKVRVADIIDVQPSLKDTLKQIAFDRITSRHFDFVVCNKASLAVVCIVELENRTQQRKSREERDTFLMSVCDSVSLPLLRMPEKNIYPIASVRTSFLAALGIPDATTFATPLQRGGGGLTSI
jgi:hypothetical protein